MKKKTLEDLLPFEFRTDGDLSKELLSLWSDKSYVYQVYTQTFNLFGDKLIAMIASNETLSDLLIPTAFKELDKAVASEIREIDKGSSPDSIENRTLIAVKSLEWSARYVQAWNEMDLETCQFYALSALRFQKDATAASFDVPFDALSKARRDDKAEVLYQAKDIKKFD